MVAVDKMTFSFDQKGLRAIERLTKAVEESNRIETERIRDIQVKNTLLFKNEAIGSLGFPTIGPECFTNRDGTVISYKGVNYFKACNELVATHPDGGQSFCIKRVGHSPKLPHEDFAGNIRAT